MASLNSLYIKKEVLETLLNVLTKKGEKGIELTVNISDTENQYGQFRAFLLIRDYINSVSESEFTENRVIKMI